MAIKRKQVIEKRSYKGEPRTIEDQGIVSAYLTKWGTVDSYNTTFVKGAFKKTFEERKGKIRLLYNHDELAGKVIDASEDDIGPYVRVQFNMDTRTGADTFAHIKAGDIDCFSFGFNRMQSRPAGNVTEITEVRLLEVGPVVFEANGEAQITDIRSTDFSETLDKKLISKRGYELLSALEWTLDDIMWSEETSDDIMTKTDTAIADFHLAYVQWLTDYFTIYERSNRSAEEAIEELKKATPTGSNAIKIEMRNYNKDELIKTTSLTEKEVDELYKGNLLSIESRSKLADLPTPIRKSHQSRRREVVSTLCDELRNSGFSSIETLRFTSLLGLGKEDRGAINESHSNKSGNELLDAIDSWKL